MEVTRLARPGRARGGSEVEKCLSLGAPPASHIDVCVGPRDGDDGDDGGDDVVIMVVVIMVMVMTRAEKIVMILTKTARVGRRLERGGQYEEGLCD